MTNSSSIVDAEVQDEYADVRILFIDSQQLRLW